MPVIRQGVSLTPPAAAVVGWNLLVAAGLVDGLLSVVLPVGWAGPGTHQVVSTPRVGHLVLMDALVWAHRWWMVVMVVCGVRVWALRVWGHLVVSVAGVSVIGSVRAATSRLPAGVRPSTTSTNYAATWAPSPHQ